MEPLVNPQSLPPEKDGETLGDRLLAGSIWIDVALQSLKSHSQFNTSEIHNLEIADLARDTELLRSRYLRLISQFPANSLKD